MAKVLDAVRKNQETVLDGWLQGIKGAIRRRDLIDEREPKSQASEVLSTICAAPPDASLEDLTIAAWQPLKELLASLSASRAVQGFTPSETALFVLSLKAPLFSLARDQKGDTLTSSTRRSLQ
jgi:rsbT co-antagonist protein RsbR